MSFSRRLAAAGLLPIALVALAVSPVLASPGGTLDQHVNDTTGAVAHAEGTTTAQTFTAGMTGRLVRVRLYCMGYGTNPNANDDTVALFTVSNGMPGQSIAASDASNASSQCDSSGSWVDFTFSSSVTVTSGAHYAIVFGGNDAWGMSVGNVYAAGTSCNDTDGWDCATVPPDRADYLFETYVLAASATPTAFVPTEPPTDAVGAMPSSTAGSGSALVVALLAVGSALVAVPARRRSTRRR